MFQRFILFAFLFLVVTQVHAQKAFRAGIVAGINATQISGDDLGGYDKLGLNAGGFCNFPLSDNWKAQFEILFSQKGSRKTPHPETGDYTEYKLQLNYVEVPLLFLRSLPNKLKKFSVEFGPSFAALMSSEESNQQGIIPGTRDFKSFEISFNIGIDYAISEKFSINFRSNNSVLPVREHAANSTFLLNRGQYSSVLELTFRYQF
jgi:hypothetical protein